MNIEVIIKVLAALNYFVDTVWLIFALFFEY